MKRQVLSLLFADLVGFSKIKNDAEIERLKTIANEFRDKFLSEENHIYFNTWGDGFYLAVEDPVDMLELSLQLRDWYRNQNWRKAGIVSDLAIRIGVHTEKASILYENGKVSDVIGSNVSTAARIEPIVPPNTIYCTRTFRDLVIDESKGFATFENLGVQELSKGFGQMELFRVTRVHEAVASPSTIENSKATSSFSMSVPKIRKTFSDEEKLSFERSSFKTISEYFQKASKELPSIDSDVKCDYEKITGKKFICRIYVKGAARAECQIWHAETQYDRGIHYSNKIDDRENSYNESLRADTDGYGLYLTALGMISFGSTQERNLSPEQAAHHLWSHFVKLLEF